jgi:hypothetical protein
MQHTSGPIAAWLPVIVSPQFYYMGKVRYDVQRGVGGYLKSLSTLAMRVGRVVALPSSKSSDSSELPSSLCQPQQKSSDSRFDRQVSFVRSQVCAFHSLKYFSAPDAKDSVNTQICFLRTFRVSKMST